MKGAKFDLASSILVGIVCVIAAYFVCNFLIGDTKKQTVTTIKTTATSSVSNPNIEIFNYRAINPTVEAYVGECQNLNIDGTCADDNNTNPAEEGN